MAKHTLQQGDPTPEEIAELTKMRPAFSEKTMMEMEKGAAHPSRAVDRRMALVVCSKSLEDLLKICTANPEAYGELVEACTRFETHVKALLDVAKAASLRAMLADARPDDLKAKL